MRQYIYKRLCAAALGGTLLAGPSPAAAQDSREDLIAAAQAEKAQQLKPYEPNKAEAIAKKATRLLAIAPNGFYPYFGSVYSGGGFTLGGGYRRFVSDSATVNVRGLYSIENYKLIETFLDIPGSARHRVAYGLIAGWRDAPSVEYRGMGIETPEAPTVFRMEQGFAGGRIVARPASWSVLQAASGYEAFTISEGKGNDPSIETSFTPATAPGLGDDPTFVHTSVGAALDSRPAADYARHGALYEVAYHTYLDTNHQYTFDRLDAEVVHHVPILHGNWVLSFRGRMQTTLSDSDTVPFFLLPSLGGGSSLRGYSSWRFRDRHAAMFSGEYRWMPNRMALDVALFYDAGTVANRFDALTLNAMKSDFGVGLRFHGPVSTPLRVEIAKGSEGLRLIFAGSAAF